MARGLSPFSHTRSKREKQARYEERFGRYVQLLEQPMPQRLGELCGTVDEGFNLAARMVVDGKEMLLRGGGGSWAVVGHLELYDKFTNTCTCAWSALSCVYR